MDWMRVLVLLLRVGVDYQERKKKDPDGCSPGCIGCLGIIAVIGGFLILLALAPH